MRCKAGTAIMFAVVGPPLKPNQKFMAVRGIPLPDSLSIRQPYIAVTPSRPIIPPSLQLKYIWSLIYNSSIRSSTDCDIKYHTDLWIARMRTGIVEAPKGRRSDFVINVIKVMYVLFWCPCVCCEIIIEAISLNSIEKFPDVDKLLMVVPINPIAQKIPTISNRHPHGNSSTQPYATKLD